MQIHLERDGVKGFRRGKGEKEGKLSAQFPIIRSQTSYASVRRQDGFTNSPSEGSRQ